MPTYCVNVIELGDEVRIYRRRVKKWELRRVLRKLFSLGYGWFSIQVWRNEEE